MPSAINPSPTGITKLTNCRLIKDGRIVNEDLWISAKNGKILDSQEVFYAERATADEVVDLGGRLVAPGFMDVQMNGGFGFDFSTVPEDISQYAKGVKKLNKSLVQTGVTAYLPTLPSQKSEVYHKVLPFLAPSGTSRDSSLGAESLGAHVEGPFISPTKNGIHSPSVLLPGFPNGIADVEACYGVSNLPWAERQQDDLPSPIRAITLAPELPGALDVVRELAARGLVVCIGHTEASYEVAGAAMRAGARMVTHLFNAMRPLHHRNPGVFGLLGTDSPLPSSPIASSPSSPSSSALDVSARPLPAAAAATPQKPFFGLIADGIHLHPTSVALAYRAHPRGCVLVTDSMALLGLPDGTYAWTNGERITKRGALLTLDGSVADSATTPGAASKSNNDTAAATKSEEEEEQGERAASPGSSAASSPGSSASASAPDTPRKPAPRIAGSAVTLVECVNNFAAWSGGGLAAAVGCVTGAPARMLGLDGVKGGLEPGCDADLVVLGGGEDGGGEGGGAGEVWVEMVWKFGRRVFVRGEGGKEGE
ncbi:hypothetical protein BDY21DRAFT_374928 [Lineolata rhizophorae]|uniref:N-acetylglucosamine-6-phosphate deacetylase n=1 Tax=Lineolata rhizophorae TaxID=578093 RepID=A0A6A6NPQ9_9PEZI|nr:hypothetical protein BDY21DRAFT_374928 [Lineolata rhizophorae]